MADPCVLILGGRITRRGRLFVSKVRIHETGGMEGIRFFCPLTELLHFYTLSLTTTRFVLCRLPSTSQPNDVSFCIFIMLLRPAPLHMVSPQLA